MANETPSTEGGSESERWAAQATRTARRVVLGVYGCTALVLALLTVERVGFDERSREQFERVRAGLRTSSAVLLEDERLTMSANLAAATGDARWIARYDAHLPQIDAAIAQAIALATPDVARRFDEATRVANDRLVAMEREAFARIAAGDLLGAQAILASPDYAAQKATLAQGSDDLLGALQAALDAQQEQTGRDAWGSFAALLALAAVGFAAMWGRLNLHLSRSESAFAAKQEEVTHLALHDTLTGLANRRYLSLQLERSIAVAERDQDGLAVLVIDLDGFKPINDRYGHATGDAVLMEISRRLAQKVRKGETAARLGGDEFVVVLRQDKNRDGVLRAAQRLMSELGQPIVLPQGDVRVGTSIDIALYPADGTTSEQLIRRADVALYRAKLVGGSEIRFFQESMDDEVRARAALELDLRRAIADGHIVPYFQPLIDLPSGRLSGFEVLARWLHPERGVVPPDQFIPIAEDTGQIDALTVSVTRAALNIARSWDPRLSIAVNIAPQQLKTPGFAAGLLALLAETGFPPERFEIEITENALIADLDQARRIVLDLKAHGISVALDDFGTGYSSLSHLSELPFDKIKIDRSFIRTLGERPESATIVHAIIGLGQSLNLPTTAEGIESEADADTLTGLGCASGQGYLYSRPVPPAEAMALIARYAARGLKSLTPRRAA